MKRELEICISPRDLRTVGSTHSAAGPETSGILPRPSIRGLLYWGGMSHWRDVDDPWTDARTLDRRNGRKDPLYNGEGTLVYPGRAVGYDGIAPSLRLKALRDGIEDYEYLSILERAGLAEAAQEIVMPIAGSWFDWEKNAAAYETARAQLAQLIIEAHESSR